MARHDKDGDECAFGGHYAEGATVSSTLMPTGQKFAKHEVYVSFSLCEFHNELTEGMLPFRSEGYISKIHVVERKI